MYAAAAAAALAAMVWASSEPAVNAMANAVLRGGFAAAVAVTASRARRWTWLVLGGVGVLVVENGVWLGVAGAGLVVAFASVLRPRRRWYGAVSCALAVQALYHAQTLAVGQYTGFVCVLATVPVFVSAYAVSPRRVRRRIHRALLVGAGVVAVAGVVWVIAAIVALAPAKNGANLARTGIDLGREGNTDRAATTLASAASEMRDAHGLLSGFWVQPAFAIPGLAQQARALEVGTREGQRLAEEGARASAKVDYRSLRYEKGRINVAKVREAQVPLRDTAAAFAEAEVALDEVHSDMLLPPIRSQVDDFLEQVSAARKDAEIASASAEVAPGLLGGDGERNYFVMFTTPAELRGLGGLLGDWAILNVRDGKAKLTETGAAEDINAQLAGIPAQIRSDEDYRLRYQRWFKPEVHIQDITVSPDLPSVAKVLREVYPAAGGAPIDGVMVIDPYGMAALLDLTGPIEVKGYPEKLKADNIVDILLKDQYAQFSDNATRRAFLHEAIKATFDKLTGMSLPSPQELARKLGPVVDARRLMFWSFDDEEGAFLDRVGISGRYTIADGHDFVGLTTQNSARNKIDVYFQRRIDYAVSIDPATGQLTAKATITLANTAPDRGLPGAVIGDNDQDYADGTNASYVSFYTPHGLRRATIDGKEIGVEYQKELGRNVYSTRVVLGAGGTAVIELDLSGSVPAGSTYALDYIPQPTVRTDQLNVEVTPAPLWLARAPKSTSPIFAGEVDIDAATASAEGIPDSPLTLTVPFRRR